MQTINTDQGRTKVEAGSAAEEADVALAAHLASRRDHPIVRALGAMSEVGDQPPLMALSGAVLSYGVLAGNHRATRAGARMLASLLLATGIKSGLKHLVARTRPNVLLNEGHYEVEQFGPKEGSWHSFPSGHTAGSVAIARAVGRVYPELRTAAYAGSAAVALIQIPRGAHYPTDVAAGGLVGLAAEAAVDGMAKHLSKRAPLGSIARRSAAPPSDEVGERHNSAGITGASRPGRAAHAPIVTAAAIAGVGLAIGAALAWKGRGGAPPRHRPQEQRAAAPPLRTYLRYDDDIEVIEPDEEETFDRIIAVMRKGGDHARKRYGRAVRTSHAKAHGLVRGELRVLDGLPQELRQGLFATVRAYPVIVRLSHVPGELLDDRTVSTPRGMALKVLGVEGEMLPGHQGETTQDWVLDTGRVFIAPGAKTFLAQITATEMAAPLPDGAKSAVSTMSRVANAALNALGLDSANLDFYGHPHLHPLGESYFSQCPIRYGDYVAKLGVFPDTRALRNLIGKAVPIRDENGLRTAVVEFFRTHPAEYMVAIQLCTDLERMPVENANVEWPADVSPYRPVARLILPPQNAFSAGRRSLIDEDLSFCPAHSLAAHRPLGSIMRARMRAYEVLGKERRAANGRSVREPSGIEEIPA